MLWFMSSENIGKIIIPNEGFCFCQYLKDSMVIIDAIKYDKK